MIQYTFTIDGQPHAKHRPRFSRYSGRAYTMESDHSYESRVALAFMQAYPNAVPLETAVSVAIVAYFKIPKGATKARRKLMESGAILPTIKADIDNIAKAVLDGLNGVAWLDDKQVVILTAQKKYGAPRVECEIKTGGGMV